MAEFDGKAPGRVRGRIAECQHERMNTLERAAQDARAQRQLPAGSDPRQLAFELEGTLLAANWYYHLYADLGYLSRGRRAVQARLASEATLAGRRALRPAPQAGETSATGNRATQGEQR